MRLLYNRNIPNDVISKIMKEENENPSPLNDNNVPPTGAPYPFNESDSRGEDFGSKFDVS